MKNISDVIRQKERDIQQKRNELQQLENDIETLRAAARLLADDGEAFPARTTSSQNIAAAVAARPANGEVKQFP